MYYLQNTQTIHTVILSFDGVMTSLSKLRFNYYRRFCKLYDKSLNIPEYYTQNASLQTMYNDCPIPSKLITKEHLKDKVEEDLYAYSLDHGIKIHDGFDELYELLKSKKIDLIYTSTHPRKYTEPLFVLTGSLYRPSKFFYDDLSIYEKYKDEAKNILVIASDIEALKLANKYRYNVIYYPTVQEENDEITIRSMAVIHHLIEAINLVLDKSRQPRHQYLLFNGTHSLEENYQQLIKTTNISLRPALDLIYNEELNRPTEDEELEEEISNPILDEMFEEETVEEVKEETIEEVKEEIVEEVEETLPMIDDTEDLFEKTMVFNQEEIENFTLEPYDDKNGQTNNDISSIISELENRELNLNHTQIFSKEELKEFGMSEDDLYNDDEEENEESDSIFKIILNSFVYAFIDAIIVLLIYTAMSIGFYDWIFKKDGMLAFMQPIIKSIYQIAMTAFGSIASTLGSYINASATLVEGMAAFMLVTCVLWVFITLGNIITNKRKK